MLEEILEFIRTQEREEPTERERIRALQTIEEQEKEIKNFIEILRYWKKLCLQKKEDRKYGDAHYTREGGQCARINLISCLKKCKDN